MANKRVQAAIVKGVKEHSDATIFFGSLGGFKWHLLEAIESGLITLDRELTEAGEAFYTENNLSELPFSRWYFWKMAD